MIAAVFGPAGGKKLTASERLRLGLPLTPGSRASSRRGDAQPSPETKPQDQQHSSDVDPAAGPSQPGKTGRTSKRNSCGIVGTAGAEAQPDEDQYAAAQEHALPPDGKISSRTRRSVS